MSTHPLLEGIDPIKHPNAWALAMAALDDFAKLGPDEMIRRRKVLRARTDMVAYASHVYEIEPAEHHKAIIEFLQDETIKRGLIIAPPGSAKSTWVSGVYASHYFSRHVDESVLLVSNTSEQVVKWTASVRDIVMGSPEYQEIFPEIMPDEDKGWTRQELYLANREDRSNVSPNLVGYGIGGPILGRRANIIIVDDPTSQTQSRSTPVMNEQKDWFKATLMSRLIPGGRVLVVLTRWSEDDLAAMLMNDMDFQVLQMPALGDPDKGAFADYILPQVYDAEGDNDVEAYIAKLEGEKAKHEAKGYECEIVRSNSVNRLCVRKYFGYEGENNQSIWPTRFSVEEYERVRRDYGSSYFRLVYDGDTSGSSGDIVKSEWFRYWGPSVTATFEGDAGPVQELPMDCQWYQFVDVATGVKAENDYFVVMTVAIDSKGRVFIVNVERKKLEGPDQPKLIQQQFTRYPLTQWVLIETVGYQLSLFQNLQRQSLIPLKKYQPTKDKIARAKSMAAVYEAGRIYHLQGAKWLDDFEYELTTFPKGKHDDQLDALSSGMEELSGALIRRPAVIQVGFG